MQQRHNPVRLYVNMKYRRVLDSQKQFLFCLLTELAELLQTFFLECLTAHCPGSRDDWYDIDQEL